MAPPRDGSGALIQNQWEAADGRHYFVWVQSTGWEYIVPKAEGSPGARFVYLGLSTATGSDGVTKPTTKPVAKCEFVPAT